MLDRDDILAGSDRQRAEELQAFFADPDIRAIFVARGGYGSPTMFVDGTDMYFGNDRMELVEAALRR